MFVSVGKTRKVMWPCSEIQPEHRPKHANTLNGKAAWRTSQLNWALLACIKNADSFLPTGHTEPASQQTVHLMPKASFYIFV